MRIISKADAMAKILGYGRIVACDEYESLYARHIDSESYTAYESDGCVIIKNEYVCEEGRFINRNIHAVSEFADVSAAYHRTFAECPYGYIKLFINDSIPDEFADCGGYLKYAGSGAAYDDEAIRVLSDADSLSIREFCSALKKGDAFSSREAKNFEIHSKRIGESDSPVILGAFAGGRLIGLSLVRFHRRASLAQIGGVVVEKSRRRTGFGKRLLLASLSVYPKAKYYCDADRKNAAGIALASNSGFTCAGAELVIPDR